MRTLVGITTAVRAKKNIIIGSDVEVCIWVKLSIR
jgi:hypothetical protein